MTLEKSARWAIIILATAAVFVALELAEQVFAPLMLGLVLGVVLSPVSAGLARLGAPRGICAFGVLLFSLVFLAGIVLFLGPVLSKLYVQAPVIWRELLASVRELQSLIRGISEASEDIARAISPDGAADAEEGGPRVPSLTDALFAAPAFAAQLMVFVGTLFFFVHSRDEIYDWITDRLTRAHDVMTLRLRDADRMVSRYFLTITVINIIFGGFVAGALALIGMPSPLLWGVIAALLNFILYLGPACVAVMLLVAGVVVYDGPAVVLPPVIFVALNLAEGQFITPLLLGRRMAVNPLLVFLSLVFWLWLWGPAGGIIAIPLLIWVLAITGQLGAPEPDPRLPGWAQFHVNDASD